MDTPNNLPADLLTLAEAAAHIGISVDGIKYHVTRRQVIPTYKRAGSRNTFVSAADLGRIPRERGGWRGGTKNTS